MSARISFVKRAAQRFLNLRAHLANPSPRAAMPLSGLAAPQAPSEPYIVPQTAMATPHQADTRVIYSKFAAVVNSGAHPSHDFLPIARLGEPVVVVKRTPTWKASMLANHDTNHAAHQIERIARLVHIVRHNKAA